MRAAQTFIFCVLMALGPPSRAEVLIGLAVPSAGPKVAYGEQLKAEVRDAVAKLNVRGGLNGEFVTIQIEDDTCSAEGGAAVAAKFVAAKVHLVLGHPCSNAALAAARVYAASTTLFLAAGARHPDLTAKRAGPTIFRLGGRDDRQAADTVAEFADQLKGRRVALVHDRTAYAKGLTDAVMAGLKARGVGDTTLLTIVAGEKDYSALITQLKTANIDAIYFAGFPSEAELIVGALRAAGMGAIIIGCDALAQSNLRERGVLIMAPTQSAPLHEALETWAKLSTSGPPTQVSLAAAWGADKNGDLPGASYRSKPARP